MDLQSNLIKVSVQIEVLLYFVTIMVGGEMDKRYEKNLKTKYKHIQFLEQMRYTSRGERERGSKCY